jgi:hypothetical protein
MEQYILKSSLVAEIENLLDKGRYHEEYDCAYRDGNNGALYALKGKLNTLEVKEVDLNFEIVKGVLNLLIEEDKVKSLLPKISKDAPKIYEGFMSNLSDLYKFVNNEYKDKVVNVVLDNIALDNLIEVKEVDLEKEYEEFVVDDPILRNFITNDTMGMELAKHFFELGMQVSNKAKKGE